MKPLVGLRVVRGPSWELSDERGDGGEGFVGVVVETRDSKGSRMGENKVWVHWDIGNRCGHRAGQYGKYYDLYILDSSPAGITHDDTHCNSCGRSPILGMRWQCCDCDDCDLCTACYMSDEHNKEHEFKRIDDKNDDGIPVGKRAGSTKIQAKGIFKGAKVKRGFNWDRNEEDGGEGREGEVLELTEYRGIPLSGAVVSWDHGDKDTYRLGYEGMVDLNCVKPGVGGCYYKKHLPKLGETSRDRTTEGLASRGTNSASSNEPHSEAEIFHQGEKVLVELPVDLLKDMCEGEGGAGWSKEMERYIGKHGSVVRVLNNAVVIKYDDGKTFEFPAGAVSSTKKEENVRSTASDSRQNVSELIEGTLVKVMDDEYVVRRILDTSGLWDASISQYLGKTGEVKQLLGDGLVAVQIDSEPVVLSDAVLTPVKDDSMLQLSQAGLPSSEAARLRMEEVKRLVESGVPMEDLMKSGALNGIIGEMMAREDCPLAKDKEETGRLLVCSASNGDAFTVNGILQSYPDVVDFTFDNHTALHKASHSGHLEVISVLLDKKASLTKMDNQGYTALHHAAYGDYTGQAVSLLFINGANVNNNFNFVKSTPLHLAVTQCNEKAVQALVMCEGCDVNMKDAVGRTPLHHAVSSHNHNLAEILIKANGSNIQLEDQLGMNPFLLAVDIGCLRLVQLMMEKHPKILTVPEKSHQMTALHFAALYDSIEMAELLLQSSYCDPRARTIDGFTPIELAKVAGNDSTAELLSRIAPNPSGGYQVELSDNLRRLLARRRRRFPVLEPGMEVRVKSDKKLVAAYQLGHGGWNTLLDLTREQVGLVVEKVGIQDVRVQFPDCEQEFIFNPAALEPLVTEQRSDALFLVLNFNFKRSETDVTGLTGNPFTCLKGGTGVSMAERKAAEQEEALLNAVLHEQVDKVKEILDINPDLANYKNEGQPILQIACAAQSVDIVSLLLDHGATVDTKDNEKFTALHCAALVDRTGKLVDFLLNAGANTIDNANTLEATPLHLAVARNNKLSFDRLLEEPNCGLECQNIYWNTPLHEAARYNREEMMQSLLSRPEIQVLAVNQLGYTALHYAILQSNLANVTMLLQHSPALASVLVQNSYAMSTLHLACMQPDVQILSAILNTEKVSIHQLDNAERTPLCLASGYNYTAIIRRLLEAHDHDDARRFGRQEDICIREDDLPLRVGDIVKVRTNEIVVSILQVGHGPFDQEIFQVLGDIGPVQTVAKNGDVDVMLAGKTHRFNPLALTLCSREPIDSKAIVIHEDKENDTPWAKMDRLSVGWKLFQSVISCHADKVNEILQTFPELVHEIFYGMSPLHLSCKDGFPFMISYLLYPDPTAMDSPVALWFGMTPLHLACFDGLPDIINLLLHKGAVTEATDDTGITPLHVAAAHDKTGLAASLLLEQGANPNAIEVCSTRTPLHIAVLRNNKAVARAILAQDHLDVNQKDEQGNTALHLAVEENKDVFVDIITACKTVQPQLKNNSNHNVLHLAVQKGRTYAARKILDCYPELIFETTEQGFTVLHIAATENRYEITELLLNTEGCAIDARNEMNQTAATLASLNGYGHLLQLLRDYGAEVEEEGPSVSATNYEQKITDSPLFNDEPSTSSTSGASDIKESWDFDSFSASTSGEQTQLPMQSNGKGKSNVYNGKTSRTRAVSPDEGLISRDNTSKRKHNLQDYPSTSFGNDEVATNSNQTKKSRGKNYISSKITDVPSSSDDTQDSNLKVKQMASTAEEAPFSISEKRPVSSDPKSSYHKVNSAKQTTLTDVPNKGFVLFEVEESCSKEIRNQNELQEGEILNGIEKQPVSSTIQSFNSKDTQNAKSGSVQKTLFSDVSKKLVSSDVQESYHKDTQKTRVVEHTELLNASEKQSIPPEDKETERKSAEALASKAENGNVSNPISPGERELHSRKVAKDIETKGKNTVKKTSNLEVQVQKQDNELKGPCQISEKTCEGNSIIVEREEGEEQIQQKGKQEKEKQQQKQRKQKEQEEEQNDEQEELEGEKQQQGQVAVEKEQEDQQEQEEELEQEDEQEEKYEQEELEGEEQQQEQAEVEEEQENEQEDQEELEQEDEQKEQQQEDGQEEEYEQKGEKGKGEEQEQQKDHKNNITEIQEEDGDCGDEEAEDSDYDEEVDGVDEQEYSSSEVETFNGYEEDKEDDEDENDNSDNDQEDYSDKDGGQLEETAEEDSRDINSENELNSTSNSSEYLNNQSSSELSTESDSDSYSEDEHINGRTKRYDRCRPSLRSREPDIQDNRNVTSSSNESEGSDDISLQNSINYDNRNVTSDESENELQNHKQNPIQTNRKSKQDKEMKTTRSRKLKAVRITTTTPVREGGLSKRKPRERSHLCEVCNGNQQRVSFQPCGHRVCKACSKKSRHCLFCGSKIEEKIIKVC